MKTMEMLAFTPGNIGMNTELLVSYQGLASESAVPVSRILIIFDGQERESTVQRGKYKLASLLYFFATTLAHPADMMPFTITAEMRQFVRDFYGPKLCLDAETNPDTIQQDIRALLTGKRVSVYLEAL